MRLPYLFVATLSLIGVLPDAHAGDREQQERAAKKACLTGDATKGTEILADLYIDTSEPVYLFNQGRCFEQNSRYEEALSRFREYLRKAGDATDAERADAQKHIFDCEALLAKAKGMAPQAPSPAPAPAPAPTADAVGQSPPAPPTEHPQPVAIEGSIATTLDADRGGTLRTAGVVTAAVGGAAVVAGLLLNLKYNGTIEDLRQRYDKDTESSNRTYKTLSQAGYGVGALFVVGGAVLYLLGKSDSGATTITFAPTLAAGSTGATLGGTF